MVIGLHGVFLAQLITDGVHMQCSCTYGVCLEHPQTFSTRVPAQSLITANQRRSLYFKSQPCVEDLLSPSVDGIREPTTSWCSIFVLPLGLHCSLQTWKRLISGNGISLDSQTIWRSFSIINNFKSYMLIQETWLATLPISNEFAERTWGNHEVTFSINSEWWSPWQLDDHCIT